MILLINIAELTWQQSCMHAATAIMHAGATIQNAAADTMFSGRFRGGPLPAISGHTKGWMCCYKNTANSDVLYISMHNNLYLPKGCTHHTP